MMNNTLESLADRASQGDSTALHSLREELESDLVPLVRCALRRGAGLPALVNWVRGRFADLADTPEPLDERQAAPVIARMLCAGVMKNLSESNHKETVCGSW
jgi:hypothetical protein